MVNFLKKIDSLSAIVALILSLFAYLHSNFPTFKYLEQKQTTDNQTFQELKQSIQEQNHKIDAILAEIRHES